MALQSTGGTDPINANEIKDWGFIDFKIDELWKASKGKGVKVAILDSGLNYTLDDFRNNPAISFFNAISKTILKEDCADDSYGHGTECAGIINGQGISKFGIAPESELLVIKVTKAEGGIVPAAVLSGLEKAILENADVISLSLSIPKSDANLPKIHEKIKEAYNKNITVLASVGDTGSLNFPVDNYPASFDECIAVGGIDRSRKRGKNSSRSNHLDIMGPGEELKSMLHPTGRISGTSFSTPFVAGVVALLKAIAFDNDFALSNIELFDLLKRTADIHVNGTYTTVDYGFGILDPLEAYNSLILKI